MSFPPDPSGSADPGPKPQGRTCTRLRQLTRRVTASKSAGVRA